LAGAGAGAGAGLFPAPAKKAVAAGSGSGSTTLVVLRIFKKFFYTYFCCLSIFLGAKINIKNIFKMRISTLIRMAAGKNNLQNFEGLFYPKLLS